MDIVEYAAKEIKNMTIEQLDILKVNYEEELVRAKNKLNILEKKIEDIYHPDILKAEYKVKEAEGNVSFISMCIRAKNECRAVKQ